VTVKPSPSRQIVIPKPPCGQLALHPGDLLEGTVESRRVILTPQALVDRRVKAAIEAVGDEISLSPGLRAALRPS